MAFTDPDAPLRIGFLGCGTIASAIATGLATQTLVKSIASISVTTRSAVKSAALRDKFPELVTVYDDPQQVVDHSDLIFCCLLPQQTSQVLKTLTFDTERHLLVSLVVSCCVCVCVCVC
jgi:pyrroline-5-carboxylate reductase